MKYFDHPAAARRYAIGRPYFHPLVMEKIQRFTGQARFNTGIDVCCGTGQSTRALRDIADFVVGADSSSAMLEQAPALEGVEYRLCSAESIDAKAETFDIMTVALALHWLQRDAFLAEAQRVLKEDGWLVIHNNGFKGEMKGNPEYAFWNQNRYLARYPSPPRDRQPLEAESAQTHGFTLMGEDSYENEVEMSAESLANYLSTQSNMIAAIESGSEGEQAAISWLKGELAKLFRLPKEVLLFKGSITYLRKSRRDAARILKSSKA